MITRIMLLPDDLKIMFQSILEYNRRGSLVNMGFFTKDGTLINDIAYMELYTEEVGGLTVRAKPEETTKEQVRGNPNIDPRQVMQPLGLEELAKLAEGD